MAEPIKIEIALEGAQEAAAEVQAVTAAVEELGQAELSQSTAPPVAAVREPDGLFKDAAADAAGVAGVTAAIEALHAAEDLAAKAHPQVPGTKGAAQATAGIQQVTAAVTALEKAERMAAVALPVLPGIVGAAEAEAGLRSVTAALADLERAKVAASKAPNPTAAAAAAVVPKVGGKLDGLGISDEAIRKSEKALEDLYKTGEKAGAGIKDLVGGMFGLLGLQSPLAGQLGQTVNALGSVQAGAAAATAGIGGMATGILAGVTALAALATALVVVGQKLTMSAAEFADQEGKQAEKLGISVESYSKLSYAAKTSNVSTQQLTNGLNHLTTSAAKNTEAFRLLQIETEDGSGATKDAGTLFVEVADKIAGYENGLEKSRLVQQLFGTSLGKELIPLLNQGGEGIRKLGQDLDEMGGVTTQEAAAAAAKFNDSLAELSNTAQILGRQLGGRLVPIVTDLLQHLLVLEKATTGLGPVMDLVVYPVKVLAGALGDLAAQAIFAGNAIALPLRAIRDLASGDVDAAAAAMAKLGEATWRYMNQRVGPMVRQMGQLPEEVVEAAKKPAAPGTETEEEKRALKDAEQLLKIERRRQEDLYQIRERGQADLEALIAKGTRAEIDDEFKRRAVSAEKYYEERRTLVERDLEIQLRNIETKAHGEEDASKRAAELQAGRELAYEHQRLALAELSREQAAATKAEEKRQADLIRVREKGETELAHLTQTEDRTSLDSRFKSREISAESYFSSRRELIVRETAIELENLRIRTSAEEDQARRQEEFAAGEAVILGKREAALKKLALEKTDDQRKVALAERAYEIHRQEMPLHEIEARLSAAQADQTLTTAQRRERIGNLLRQELALLPALEEAARAEANSSDLDTRIRGENKLLQIQTMRMRITGDLENARPDSFLTRFNKGLGELSDRWENVSANMADALTGSLASAFDNIGDKVLDVASGVKSIGELGMVAFRQLVSSMISAVVQWVAQMTIVRALKKAFTAEQVVDAGVRATAEAPAAAMASVGSWGAAAVVGGLALAAIIAMAVGAFETGGRVRGGEQLIRVNERGEEMVINAQATQRWAPLLERINQGATMAAELRPHLPQPDHSASAGHQAAQAEISGRAVGSATPAIQVPEPTVQIHYANTQREVERIIASRPGRKIVVKHLSNARGSQGLEPI